MVTLSDFQSELGTRVGCSWGVLGVLTPQWGWGHRGRERG